MIEEIVMHDTVSLCWQASVGNVYDGMVNSISGRC